MSTFNHLPSDVKQSLLNRSLLKVISGLNNFDKNSVIPIAKAADKGNANLLDVACDPDLVRLVTECTNIPVCVSAVDPSLFPAAIESGASMIEIGNFDSFYPEGRFFDSAEVIALTEQTKTLLPHVFLSVTVPHTLPLDKQSELALELVEKGADLIQTEGGTSARPLSAGNLGLIEKAAPALAAVHSIVDSFKRFGCSVPVLASSGLSVVTAPMAISVGASGIGVGSAINRLNNEIEMVAAIRSIREAISSTRSLTKKL